MVSTITRSSGGGSVGGSDALPSPSRVRAALGRVRRRVQWWKVLSGLMVIGLCVLAGSALLTEQNTEVRIWVTESSLTADQPAGSSAFTERVVRGTPGFAHYSVGEWQREDMAGLIPLVDIPAGTVLHESLFHTEAFVPVPPGDAAVAVVVNESHLPVGLSLGDSVLLVGVPAVGADGVAEGAPGSTVFEYEAVVLDVARSDTATTVTVTVAVGQDSAADATWLASRDRIALAELR